MLFKNVEREAVKESVGNLRFTLCEMDLIIVSAQDPSSYIA